MNDKLNEQISFTCNNHKLYYEELQRQIESGERPIIKSATSNLGFSKGYLLKKSYKHAWAKEMITLFKSASKDWRKNGNHPTAVKFEQELQAMKESGEKPISSVICKRVGVNEAYLRSAPNLKVVWLMNLYIKFKKVRKHWEKTGGAEYKKCKEALKAIITKGELPTKTEVAKVAGFQRNYFFSGNYLWKKKLITEIEQAALEWKSNGGKELEKLRNALNNIKKRGEEPTINKVCTRAHYQPKNLKDSKFKWQRIEPSDKPQPNHLKPKKW